MSRGRASGEPGFGSELERRTMEYIYPPVRIPRRTQSDPLGLFARTPALAHWRPSALLALGASTAVLTYRRPSALLALGASAAVLAYRCPAALLALGAFATVRAYRRPSALLALAALAAVLTYRRPSALFACRLFPSMLAVALPMLGPDAPPLEAAVLERYLLVLAAARLTALFALGRGHTRSASAENDRTKGR